MTRDEERSPIYTRRFWAKAFPYRQRGPGRIHLLEHHLADVGACFEALLRQPTIRKRLARSGGLEDLDEVTVARLCVLAALHDIGKVNMGFQTKVWRSEDFGDGGRPSWAGWAGHTADLVPVLKGRDRETNDWFLNALGWNEILTWDNDGGNTASAMFVAAMSHHGEPLNLFDTKEPNPAVWEPFRGMSPEVYVRRLSGLVRRWFPAALTQNRQPLPSAPSFQHMFLGLCTLADWIGSDEHHFKFLDEPRDDYIQVARERAAAAMETIGLDVSEQRRMSTGVPDFPDLFDIAESPPPNAIQQAVYETQLNEPLLVIESETGSGKTEAALWRFARMYEAGYVDGLYFALPTRAAAVQIHDRVNRFIARMFPNSERPEPVLAVPGYVRAGDFGGRHLPDYEVWWEDSPDETARRRRWAAESSKRFLAAQIAVGTVDQAMMAALQVRHSHMRAACLARNLLVIDEVHASDPYMRVIIEALLNTHIGSAGFVILMSATLGSAARRRWVIRPRRESDLQPQSMLDAIDTPYPALTVGGRDGEGVMGVGENGQNKSVRIEANSLMNDFDQVAHRALEAAHRGAKVLIIRNTVEYAVRTQVAIEGQSSDSDKGVLFTCNGVAAVHTGRFAAGDRRLLDAEVENQVGRDRTAGGRIIVGTQTLEQSLDIDADLLITDLCPMDVLLQRIGRLHRHDRDDRADGYTEPRVIVLTPSDQDLSSLLSRASGGTSRNGLGPSGFVYPDVRVLELTRRLIAEYSETRRVCQIPDMNRELVERTTHPEALDKLVVEMGDDWKVHANEMVGEAAGDIQFARMNRVVRDKSFLEEGVAFAGGEEHIRTRLGDESVDVVFDPRPTSPFEPAIRIQKIPISARWLSKTAVPDSVTTSPEDGGFVFEIGGDYFSYSRFGLQRAGRRP